MTHAGGCLCGAVRYDVDGPLRELLVCHCHECRSWAGRAWAATAAHVADLAVTGEPHWLPSPQSQSGAERGTCPACGASLFWRVPGSDRVSIGAGTLDDQSSLRVAGHIWVAQAAAWERPPAGLPAYPGSYPDDGPPLAWS